MPVADRTHPVILDHFKGVLAALEDENLGFPTGEWKRPKDLDERFIEPPYLLARIFPSAGEFDGSLADSQTDITLRFELLGVGKTHNQALNICDRARVAMQPRKVVIPNRYIQSLRLMVVAGGISRDDDLPIPFYASPDLYTMRTTPS